VSDIDDIEKECSQQDWDGYNGDPITKKTADNARLIMSLLKLEPHIAPYTGHISFEFRDAYKNSLLISVGETYKLTSILYRPGCTNG